jgi:hypothetical protein
MGGGMPVSYVLTTRIQNAKIKNTVEINGVFLRFVRAPSFAG